MTLKSPTRLQPLVALLAVTLLASTTLAGEVSTNGPITLLTGRLLGRGDGEALFLWDNEDQKLAVYLIAGQKMELLFVRNCEHDFAFKGELGKSTPTPKQIKGKLEEAGKDVEDATPVPADDEGEVAAPAPAAAPIPGNGFTLTLGSLPGGTADLIYIYGHAQRRLNVYSIKGKTLELMFSRNCDYDLKIGNQFGQGKPSVADMKKVGSGQKQEEEKGDDDNRKSEVDESKSEDRLL